LSKYPIQKQLNGMGDSDAMADVTKTSDNITSAFEIFVSQEGTQYKWDHSKETIVRLTDEEIRLLKARVSLMHDDEIQNTHSGNGTPMGIPVAINQKRLQDVKFKLAQILADGPFIGITAHAISRMLEDALLDDEDPNKRGWESQQEIKDCVLNVKKVHGVRLNLDHDHPDNTSNVKHLHSQMALVIRGPKGDEAEGRLVLVILDERSINVITIL
jgi:hypothetical protein